MSTSPRLIVLAVTLLLCLCLTEIECRRTTSTSRRGSSNRRNNYGSSHQGNTQSSFFSFFGNKKSGSSSTGSGSSSTKVKSSSGWTTAQQAPKTSGSQNPSWANPYYKPSAPKPQGSTYGWAPSNKKPETNHFQNSGQPSSNIGAGGYPVQSGFRPAQQSHGFQTAQQANTYNSQPHGFNTPQHGFHSPQQSHGFNTAQQPHGFNTAQQPHGFNTAQQPHGFNTAQQPHGFNTAQQPHGFNTAQQPHGFNTAQQPHGYNPAPHGFNTGYHPQPSYNQPSYSSGSNFGGYQPSNTFGQQGFASSHGISPNYYPSHNSFGYPGQGILGGSHGPKYGGQGLFGGGTGNFGYPGGSSWGVPTYGSKSSSGKGKLLTGLALGAAGGYLTSSLVNKISNPWGYSGYGYGNRFGYDRPIVIKEIRETTKTESPAAPGPEPTAAPDPSENWIHCVAFDPTTNTTLINPNCSCTVTTVVDPMTGLPISTHNCTTANGQVIPQPIPPVVEQLPPNGVNQPGAVPSYGGLYQDNMRYGAVPPAAPVPPDVGVAEPPKTESPPATTTTEPEVSSTVADVSTTPDSTADSQAPYDTASKVKEFYSQLEQIVNMGKFQ